MGGAEKEGKRLTWEELGKAVGHEYNQNIQYACVNSQKKKNSAFENVT